MKIIYICANGFHYNTVSNVTQGLIHTLHMFLSLHVHNIMFLMFFQETCNCVYPFTLRRNKTVFIPVLPVRPSPTTVSST